MASKLNLRAIDPSGALNTNFGRFFVGGVVPRQPGLGGVPRPGEGLDPPIGPRFPPPEPPPPTPLTPAEPDDGKIPRIIPPNIIPGGGFVDVVPDRPVRPPVFTPAPRVPVQTFPQVLPQITPGEAAEIRARNAQLLFEQRFGLGRGARGAAGVGIAALVGTAFTVLLDIFEARDEAERERERQLLETEARARIRVGLDPEAFRLVPGRIDLEPQPTGPFPALQPAIAQPLPAAPAPLPTLEPIPEIAVPAPEIPFPRPVAPTAVPLDIPVPEVRPSEIGEPAPTTSPAPVPATRPSVRPLPAPTPTGVPFPFGLPVPFGLPLPTPRIIPRGVPTPTPVTPFTPTPTPIPTPTPLPIPIPDAQPLPQPAPSPTPTSRCPPCQSVQRRRRRRGKCREGFFREFAGRTEFITWRERACSSQTLRRFF